MQEQSILSHDHNFSISGNTNDMSKNATGRFGGTDGGFSGKTDYVNGNIKGYYKRTFDGNGSYPFLFDCYINVSHTHSFSASGTTDSAGNTENRPSNYTIRIWRRIS